MLGVLMYGVEGIGESVEVLWLGRGEKDLGHEVEGSKWRRWKKSSVGWARLGEQRLLQSGR